MRTTILVGAVAAILAATLSATAALPPFAAAVGLSFATPALAGGVDETVEFRNLEPIGIPHTVTSDALDGQGAPLFHTGTVLGGGSAPFTLPAQAGTYTFFCAFHPWMRGAVVVE